MYRIALFVVLGLLGAHTANAQTCSARNTSCETRRCCVADSDGIALYCNDDGVCKRCAGSTYDPVACETTTTTTTTLEPGSTTSTTLDMDLPFPAFVPSADETTILREEDLRGVRGQHSDELERDMIVHQRRVLTLQAARYARGNPNCADAYEKCEDLFTEIYRRYLVDPSYRGGVWPPKRQQFHVHRTDSNASHLYGNTIECGEAIRSCSLSRSAKNNCATTVPVQVAGFLGITVLNESCVSLPQPVVLNPKDRSRALQRMLDGDDISPPLDSASQVALADLSHEHKMASDFACGLGPAPKPGAVPTALAVFESLAQTPVDSRLRHIIPFTGDADPAWPADKLCGLKSLQNIAMHGPNPTRLFGGQDISWDKAVRGGDVAKADVTGALHAIFHDCATLRGNYKVEFPVETVEGVPLFSGQDPPMTCDEYLDQPGLLEELLAAAKAHS